MQPAVYTCNRQVVCVMLCWCMQGMRANEYPADPAAALESWARARWPAVGQRLYQWSYQVRADAWFALAELYQHTCMHFVWVVHVYFPWCTCPLTSLAAQMRALNLTWMYGQQAQKELQVDMWRNERGMSAHADTVCIARCLPCSTTKQLRTWGCTARTQHQPSARACSWQQVRRHIHQLSKGSILRTRCTALCRTG